MFIRTSFACKNTEAPLRETFWEKDFICKSDRDCEVQMVKGCSYIAVNKKSYICVSDVCLDSCPNKETVCVKNKCELKRNC